MTKLRLGLILPMLFIALAAFGQDIPDAPGYHFFGSRTDKGFAVAQGVLLATDFALTHHVMSTPSGCSTANALGQPYKYPVCHRPWELDPVARPFVMRGTALQVTYFAGSWVVDMAMTYELRKHGHPKMARWLQVFAMTSSAWGIETCATHM